MTATNNATAPLGKLSFTFNSAAADADGLADDVNASSGEALTLAANDAGDDLAHLITFTPSGSITGNYVITGTGPNGQAQTETVATSTDQAVTSTLYFMTVTEVLAPAGIGAETIDIGWAAGSVTPWYPLTKRMTRMNFGITVTTGSSPTFSMQHTFDGTQAFIHASVSGATANVDGSYTGPIGAIRALWTAAGEITFSSTTAID